MTKTPSALSLADLAEKLAETLGSPKGATKEAVKDLFATLGKTVLGGGTVRIHGLGTFKLKTRKARTGRNPRTGEAIKIAASKSVGFKPAAASKSKAPAKKSK